ncbi:helix-turn-helix domain-containing protein [Streptomyces sp. NPDC005012]|uniref:helix-turn-helix domain-containing protein n=1 Tax=Streptomyces sp. NPDC005012 TaxID=3154558 RepID=UPI0033AD5B9D
MSAETREWVWEYSSSRGTARLVLLSIADRVADEQCVAWASLSSLVERTCASRTAVRAALAKLVESGELEQREDLDGPQRTTVYRLPRAAAHLAMLQLAWKRDPDAEAPAYSADGPVPPLRVEALRRYGIRPVEGPESAPSAPASGGQESDPSRRNVTPRGYGFRHLGGTDSDPQNRSEPKVNRRNSRAGAAVTSAADWQVDQVTHSWALQNGHVERLGEDGLRAADAKWRAHRSTHPPRPAAAWAADWRSWIAREHSPTPLGPLNSPHQGRGTSPAAGKGMTRVQAHTAALLAALEKSTPKGAAR